ncbi:MAG TPA: glycoside hydrolase family 15 protein [Xanthobacteraceae bacterium]|nr:glycoside hydrolase family 15 protein [Xanthobacteraceae bacterium]
MDQAVLEDYALLGDGESAALVRNTGSIDWMCWPRFDSDACFAALLGSEENGHWSMSPSEGCARIRRAYRRDTLILETDFVAPGGTVRVTDFMPLRKRTPALIRVASGLEGSVAMRSVLKLRFGYGAVPPWVECSKRRAIATVGPDMMVLHTDAPLARRMHDICSEFVVEQGERRAFVLQLASPTGRMPGPIDVARALIDTESFWHTWIRQFDRPTNWPDAVRRSLIVLKAMISRTTGGMVAAPTTSLPEVPGGEMNWDYRYCWLRDSSFAIATLLSAGYHQEAAAWRDWALRAIAGSPEHIQIMYRCDGGRYLTEWKVPWLSGYSWSEPVRIGNAAAGQRQIDALGDLVHVLNLAADAGIELGRQGRLVERSILEHLETAWLEAGHGIWEQRGPPRHYVYGKLMAWVAADRFLRRCAQQPEADAAFVQRMESLKAEIHRDVCRRGFDTGINAFIGYYGGQELDASLLLMPLVDFLPVEDARVTSTIQRIEHDLMEDGLLYRTTRARRDRQGAFLACSCWLADCRRMQGRTPEAKALLDRVLALQNDVGLLSEEYDLRSRRLSGNFPQALSHLTVVRTALGLAQADPPQDRGRISSNLKEGAGAADLCPYE